MDIDARLKALSDSDGLIKVKESGDYGLDDEGIELIKQIFKDAGYIHIPTSQGKNVTVYTSDNPEPLMTENEWRKLHNG